MKDTHPAMEEKFLKMMAEKTGEERLKFGFEMYDMARAIVSASVPAGSEKETLANIFNRFYDNDLPFEFRQKFLEKLRERR